MKAFAATLMSAFLLAHALLGCCWHHEHGCATHGAVAHSDECCNYGDCPTHDSGPCNCRIECGSVCVYISLEKTVVDCSPVMLDVVALNPTLPGNHSAKLLSWELASGLAASAPPLRLHLLHQILVI